MSRNNSKDLREASRIRRGKKKPNVVKSDIRFSWASKMATKLQAAKDGAE